MLMIQLPTPAPGGRPASALLIWVPCTALGPRRYFAAPSLSHATTIASAGSWSPPWRAAGSRQFSAAYFSRTAFGIALSSALATSSALVDVPSFPDAFVGDADGFAEDEGLADFDGEALAEGSGLGPSAARRALAVARFESDVGSELAELFGSGDEVESLVPPSVLGFSESADLSPSPLVRSPRSGMPVVGSGPPDWSTGRKRRSAVWPTCSTMRLLFWPGTLTTMLSLPSVFTWASDTPNPLTRWRMIWTAWFIASPVIFPSVPGIGFAVSVTLVPPARSMARRGCIAPTPIMAAMPLTRRASVRASERRGLLSLRTTPLEVDTVGVLSR